MSDSCTSIALSRTLLCARKVWCVHSVFYYLPWQMRQDRCVHSVFYYLLQTTRRFPLSHESLFTTMVIRHINFFLRQWAKDPESPTFRTISLFVATFEVLVPVCCIFAFLSLDTSISFYDRAEKIRFCFRLWCKLLFVAYLCS